MTVIVLGKNGMLGRYVYNYLINYYEVIGVTRNELDASTINRNVLMANIKPGYVVINCIGIIKQRNEVKKLDFVAVNSLFPLILQEVCAKRGGKLIHVTTDCVFDGLKGNYDESSRHDAIDVYGMSKSLGEPEEATVIRTSIIGEERGQARSLFEWVKSNKNNTVNGYTNHFWNGITCLQFAKICDYMIGNNIFWEGVKHIVSPNTVSKFELVKMISDIYGFGINVVPFETPEKCDRSLTSIREDITIGVPTLETQIKEMKEFEI